MIISLKYNFVKIGGVIWLNNKKRETKIPYLENIIERVGG